MTIGRLSRQSVWR